MSGGTTFLRVLYAVVIGIALGSVILNLSVKNWGWVWGAGVGAVVIFKLALDTYTPTTEKTTEATP